MAVEIVIFSGARQGERLELDVGEFRVGGEPGCEVFFDPQSDPGAKDRSALFRLADDGWYVKSTGVGELLVNQQPVSGRARIRSGDVVRMSDRGPDFTFTILTAASKATATPPELTPVLVSPSEAAPASPPRLPSEDVPASTSASPTTPAETGSAAPAPAASDDLQKRAFWLAGGLALFAMLFLLVVCILLFVLVYSLIFPPDGPDGFAQTGDTTTQRDAATTGPGIRGPPRSDSMQDDERTRLPEISGRLAASGTSGQPFTYQITATNRPSSFRAVGLPDGLSVDSATGLITGTPRPGSQGTHHVTISATNAQGTASETLVVTIAPPKDRWDTAFEQVKGAIYLLEVESSEYSWALATCCAVSENTLLCTARAVCEMEWLRHEGRTAEEGPLDYRFSVTSRPRGKRLPVKESRIYAPFAKEQEKWVYFDLAVITVEGKLPQAAPLASQDDLEELDTDYPLAVVGVGHDGQRISKSFAGDPELAVGGVYLITRFDESPGSPWVLHLKMEAPKNARGSPVINRRGRIVGVYSIATPPRGGVDMNLHWAPVVEPGLIRTWTDKRDTTIWIPPFVPEFSREAKPD